MKTDLFQSCGHCWVFQICWHIHIQYSTFTASFFRIWNSSTGIPSPPLALFVVMLFKAHLTSHSRISGSRWVLTPLWLSRSWSSFLYSSSVYSRRKQWHPTPVLLPGKFLGRRSLVGCMQAMGVAKSWKQLSDFTFTFHFNALEKEMAIHSSVIAWRNPGTGEPGGLPFMGSHRVGHDWSDLAVAVCVFLPLLLDIFCFC